MVLTGIVLSWMGGWRSRVEVNQPVVLMAFHIPVVKVEGWRTVCLVEELEYINVDSD